VRAVAPRAVLAALVVASVGPVVRAGVVDLRGVADGDTAYYEYPSDAFFRMDLVDGGTTNQRFHLISNPSVAVGSAALDGFPNDGSFRMGSVTYDESTLVGGSGIATITHLSFGIGSDPADSGHVNFGRWTPITTYVDGFAGTVTVQDSLPVAVGLTSSVRIEYPVLSTTFSATGTFSIAGSRFDGHLSGDTWSPGNPNVWDFQGTLTTVPEPSTLWLGLLPGALLWMMRRPGGA